MYDWSLDVVCLPWYGTRKGCEPLHAYYNPVTRKAGLLNTTLKDYTDLSIIARIYNLEGKLLWEKRDESELQGEYGAGLLDIPVPEGIQGAHSLTAGFECGRSQYLLADNRAERLHQLISTSEVKTGYQDRDQERKARIS